MCNYNNNNNFGLLWFEHNNSSTQMRRLTSLALTRLNYRFILLKFVTINNIFFRFAERSQETQKFIRNMPKANREYPIRTDVINKPNKFQACHLKPLGQFSFLFSRRYTLRIITSYFLVFVTYSIFVKVKPDSSET